MLEITPDFIVLEDTNITYHKVLIPERPPRFNDFRAWIKLIENIDRQMDKLTGGAWHPVSLRFHPSISIVMMCPDPNSPGRTLKDFLEYIPRRRWKVQEDYNYCKLFGEFSILITCNYTGTSESYPVAIVFEPSSSSSAGAPVAPRSVQDRVI